MLYIIHAVPICLLLDRHEVCRAFSRAFAYTGNSIDARIEMIAMTTSNSIKVKPRLGPRIIPVPPFRSPARPAKGNQGHHIDDSP